ncbi:MAG: enolase C-terminal domain-like protein [Nitrospinota bacterium]|nr:enolase C-terminal domain-like protein [Nitrospinota bacterium]
MKISSIDVYKIDMPMKGFFRNARHNHNIQEGMVVHVKTDNGLDGIGDIEPTEGYTKLNRNDIAEIVEKNLSPILIGEDPRNFRRISYNLDSALYGLWEGKSAITLALTDIHAKSLGVSLSELLGGSVVEKVFFNAWIGVLSNEDASLEAKKFRQKGWRACKVKLNGGVSSDIERVLAVREGGGKDFEIRVDANESYRSIQDAQNFIKEVSSANIRLFEQPFDRKKLDDMAELRRSVEIPIMADECVTDYCSLFEVVKREAADIVKLKIMKQGSVFKVREMISMLEGAGLEIVIGHGFGLTPQTIAEIHLASTSKSVLSAIESVGPYKMIDDVVNLPLEIDNGEISVPSSPGLGVSIDMNKIEEFRV